MSGSLAAFIVLCLISSTLAVDYLWQREATWWKGWRDWLQYAPLCVLAYWLGVLHGFLWDRLGTRLSLASLLVVIALVLSGVIWNEPHLLPPGARVQRRLSHP